MGYRERSAHRQQQKQQSLGQGYQSERRVTLPAPKTMNLRDGALEIGPEQALLMENAFWDDGGLNLTKLPQSYGPILISTSVDQGPGPLITYYGSGSTSAEFWCVATGGIHRITNQVASFDATSSVDRASIQSGGDWVEFSKTIIYVVSNPPANNQYWTRASGWSNWTPSVSASFSAADFIGISKFKSRLYAWAPKSTIIFYGSVDQITPTFNPFDLGAVLTGSLRQVVSLPRDGGAGPDDYIAFISDQGDVAVYDGNDPGDAANWSLVGTYKIGRPVSRDSHVTYGNEVVIMCEDDFYFLPSDMVGKKNRTLAATFREADPFEGVTNAVFDQKKNKLIFGDGTCFDPSRGYSFSQLKLFSADPAQVRQRSQRFWRQDSANGKRPVVGEFKGNSYVAATYNPDSDSSAELIRVRPIFDIFGGSPNRGLFKSKVRTAPIQTSGRTNISLVSPIIGSKTKMSAESTYTASSQPLIHNLSASYAIGIEYDVYNRPLASASSDVLVCASIDAQDNFDAWHPGFGTGDYATIYMEVSYASANQDVVLYGFKTTVSDTGGL